MSEKENPKPVFNIPQRRDPTPIEIYDGNLPETDDFYDTSKPDDDNKRYIRHFVSEVFKSQTPVFWNQIDNYFNMMVVDMNKATNEAFDEAVQFVTEECRKARDDSMKPLEFAHKYMKQMHEDFEKRQQEIVKRIDNMKNEIESYVDHRIEILMQELKENSHARKERTPEKQ